MTLNELISAYRKATKHLKEVQFAEESTFMAALARCRELRAQINAQCPQGSLEAFEYNTVAEIR